MSIKISSFMGSIGWAARKYFPNLASWAYLKLQFLTRTSEQSAFIKFFLEQDPLLKPQVVNIETINRCNSTCAFCAANKDNEKRPFMKMTDELYHSIIDQLAAWDYKGHLTLYGNNEPWLDSKIVERHRYAREKLPESFIFMSTNGLLLSLEKVKEIQPYINQLIINNYGSERKMHPNLQEIYDYVSAHPQEFEDLEIIVQMRYLQEVLTNRAGSAPNTAGMKKEVTASCILPFTDLWITPNGKVGLCCCDNYEVTDFGDLNTTPLKDIWEGEKLQNARRVIATGRQNYPFCRHCDFIDAGFRGQVIQRILAGDLEGANHIGGEEKN